MTGLLHISDRLPADESSRVEAARGTLYSLPIEDIHALRVLCVDKEKCARYNQIHRGHITDGSG